MDQINSSIGKLLIAGLFGLLTGGGGYQIWFGSADDQKIESLSREAAQHREIARNLESELSEIKPELEGARGDLQELREKHGELERKWQRCTGTAGSVIVPDSLSSKTSEVQVATGDRLKFELRDTSIFLRVARVTNDGPVLQIRECPHPGVLEGTRQPTDGPNSFLVQRPAPFVFAASSECCEKGLAVCPTDDLEEITVSVADFSVSKQTAVLKHRKTLIGGEL